MQDNSAAEKITASQPPDAGISSDKPASFSPPKKSSATPAANPSVAGLNAFQLTTVTTALIVTAAISFMAGVLYNRQTALAYSEDFSVFWQTWQEVDDNFYFTLPSEQERVYGAIQGMVGKLNDPYTSFAPPEQAEEIRRDMAGEEFGIGAYVAMNESGDVYIVRPIPGSPAEQAGILGGDIIRAVNGESIVGWDLERVTETIKGEENTEVQLTFYRPVDDEMFDLTITRARFEETVVFVKAYDDIIHLRLKNFKGVADNQMSSALDEALRQNPRGIILDLRENGGGYLAEAVTIADLFLDKGIILIQKSRQGDPEIINSKDGDAGEEVFLVVLIDGDTASAAEVVAGALQDRERAVIIGQKSFGKGIVQTVIDLSDGSQLKYTSSAWYTPNDRAIHEIGLEPDVLIEGDQYAGGRDIPLETAIEYINTHTTNSVPAASFDQNALQDEVINETIVQT